MTNLPSAPAIAALILTLVTFWLFATARLRIEIVCLLLIAVLALAFYFFPLGPDAPYSGMEIAFGGFGHEALVAICCLMILGRGLVVTGALEPAARVMVRLWRFNKALGLLFSLLFAGGASMVVNDTPVLVLTLPLLLNLATRTGVPPSKTLMPVNFAILIGGMSTAIGTSTNLLVVSIAQDLGIPRIGIFQFTDLALVAGAIALPYVWLVMPRLLPANSAAVAMSTRRFDASLHLTPTSAAIGAPIAQIEKSIGHGLTVTGVLRKGMRLPAGSDRLKLEPGDIVRVEGDLEHLRDASTDLKAPLAHPAILETLNLYSAEPAEDQLMAEVVVGSQSALIGQSIKSAQIADRYGVAVLGLFRAGRGYFGERRHSVDERLRIGDVLLVQGPAKRLRDLELGEGAMVLEGAAEMPRTRRAIWALLIFASVVAFAAAGIVPIAISSLAGTIAMLATGCVKFDGIGRGLSPEVILLVAASLALGRALEATGAAAWMGGAIAFALQALPPAAVLAAVMAFAAFLTNFASNATAAGVSTPIAVSLASQIGIPAEPLVLAVLFGCNLCYATPVAYQTNILIMTAGGYQFKDYLRAGLPLLVIMIVSLSILLDARYGL